MLLPCLATTSGCIPNSRLLYLQDDAQQPGNGPVVYSAERKPYTLQTGDVLSVQIKGVDTELQSSFNITSGAFGGAIMADPATQYVNGYTIDENGDIPLISVGKVRVKGLTIEQAQEICQKRIGAFLRDATVMVKMVSFKITVLGEVRRPGYYYVNNLRCNLLEAIGLGGDLTPIANRKRLKVIRQLPTGSEVAYVDLTDAKIIQSPYYNLQPNDIIFVEPLSGQTPRKNFAPVSLGLGIVSGLVTVTLLVLTIRRDGLVR